MKPSLLGYVDRLSVAQGDTIRSHVHCATDTVAVSTVRVFSGDPNIEDPTPSEPVPDGVHRRVPGSPRPMSMGSRAVGRVPAVPRPTITMWVFPTNPSHAGQVLAHLRSNDTAMVLRIEPDLSLSVSVADVEQVRTPPLECERWTSVVAGFDATGRVVARTHPGSYWGGGTPYTARGPSPFAPWTGDLTVALAARQNGDGSWCEHLDGKIDQPSLFDGPLDIPVAPVTCADDANLQLVASWSDARGPGWALVDSGPHRCDLQLINGPTRRVSGRLGAEVGTRCGGATATHFHADDVLDHEWPATFEWTVPDDVPSGVYGFVLETDDAVDVVPFFVTPARRSTAAPIAVVLPTFTWLAYANRASWLSELDLPESDRPRRLIIDWATKERTFSDRDRLLLELPELGRGCYDVHADGSSVVLSSITRPLVTVRPDALYLNSGAGRDLSGNLYLIEWLHRSGLDAAVLTDHDVHHHGAEILQAHPLVIHPGHPEYASLELLDAIEAYLHGGGNLAVLGGNCYEYVCGVLDDGWTIEVRRDWNRWYERGSEALTSNGINRLKWAELGRFPSAITGTASLAEGHPPEEFAGYRIEAGAADPDSAFVFRGVDVTKPIGRFGFAGGAAGDELDGIDTKAPQPSRLLHLATSHGEHGAAVRPFRYDVIHDGPPPHGPDHPDVRADMVLYRHDGGGRVFSVGSINWCASLLHDGGRNDVATITRNVIDEFCAPPARSDHETRSNADQPTPRSSSKSASVDGQRTSSTTTRDAGR